MLHRGFNLTSTEVAAADLERTKSDYHRPPHCSPLLSTPLMCLRLMEERVGLFLLYSWQVGLGDVDSAREMGEAAMLLN